MINKTLNNVKYKIFFHVNETVNYVKYNNQF